jgi:hypothetical protein
LHWPFTPAKSLQNIAREGARGSGFHSAGNTTCNMPARYSF